MMKTVNQGKEMLSIEFGALAPSLSEQLRQFDLDEDLVNYF